MAKYELASGIMFKRCGYLINIYKLKCDVVPRIYIKELKKEE